MPTYAIIVVRMTYELLSDEAVFALVRDENDQEAFAVLYRRYNKRVYAYCVRALGNPEDARDVFQSVVLTIYDKRRSFSDGSFAAWLFTITRNMCLKTLRNRKQTSEFVEELHDTEESGSNSPDFLLRAELRKAINDLPAEFREALELRYFDDLTYEDIAEALSISVSLAKVRVFRAKKILAKTLSPILDEL